MRIMPLALVQREGWTVKVERAAAHAGSTTAYRKVPRCFGRNDGSGGGNYGEMRGSIRAGREWATEFVRRKPGAVWVASGASGSFAQVRAQDDTVKMVGSKEDERERFARGANAHSSHEAATKGHLPRECVCAI